MTIQSSSNVWYWGNDCRHKRFNQPSRYQHDAEYAETAIAAERRNVPTEAAHET